MQTKYEQNRGQISKLSSEKDSQQLEHAFIVEELENKFKASALKASDLEEVEKKLKTRASETEANLEKTQTELGHRDREFTAEKKKVEEVKRETSTKHSNGNLNTTRTV